MLSAASGGFPGISRMKQANARTLISIGVPVKTMRSGRRGASAGFRQSCFSFPQDAARFLLMGQKKTEGAFPAAETPYDRANLPGKKVYILER